MFGLQSDVEIAAANVLDIAAELDPTKIVAKLKYHLLAHLREDILRFGPLVGVATEIFESFNAIFRYCSIFSNHMAPSHDIAHQLSEQETVKFILSGGWTLSEGGGWKQPGPGVRNYVENQPILRKLCGWTEVESTVKPGESILTVYCQELNYTIEYLGTIKLEATKRQDNPGQDKRTPRKAVTWSTTYGAKAVNVPIEVKNMDLHWNRGKHVVSSSQDICTVGSWVYARSPILVSTSKWLTQFHSDLNT